jgi:anti-anti-sigma factor
MQLGVEKIGDVTVVSANVEQLDAGNADHFKRAVAPVLDGCRNLVLDLSRVQFLDSRGCGVIISCLKHLGASGGDLILCGVSAPVRVVLELVRMHRICRILPSKEEAVRAFQPS